MAAVGSWSDGFLGSGFCVLGGSVFCVLLPSTLVAERWWGLSFVLALTLPLSNLCLQ